MKYRTRNSSIIDVCLLSDDELKCNLSKSLTVAIVDDLMIWIRLCSMLPMITSSANRPPELVPWPDSQMVGYTTCC